MWRLRNNIEWMISVLRRTSDFKDQWIQWTHCELSQNGLSVCVRLCVHMCVCVKCQALWIQIFAFTAFLSIDIIHRYRVDRFGPTTSKCSTIQKWMPIKLVMFDCIMWRSFNKHIQSTNWNQIILSKFIFWEWSYSALFPK